jgi:hypothetical protein
MCLSKIAVPNFDDWRSEANVPLYKSCPDIVVVNIDEEGASMVTCEYVTLVRYMVYNMEPDSL